MVFNVVAVNQDDHVKNLSFHMLPDGPWRLAPAYDITFARGLGYTSQHQLRIADKRADITSAELTAVGRGFGIRAPHRIVERTLEVTARWTDYAREVEVPADSVAHIEKELAQRRRELAHGSSPK